MIDVDEFWNGVMISASRMLTDINLVLDEGVDLQTKLKLIPQITLNSSKFMEAAKQIHEFENNPEARRLLREHIKAGAGFDLLRSTLAALERYVKVCEAVKIFVGRKGE